MKKVDVNILKELVRIRIHEEEIEYQLHDLRKNRLSTSEEYSMKCEQYKDVCNRRKEFIKDNKLPSYLQSIKSGSLSNKIKNSESNSDDGVINL